MKTNETGIEVIKSFEALRLRAYMDPASPRARYLRKNGVDDPKLSAEPWTIGWGHTRGVKEGTTITAAQAEELFQQDLAEAERGVLKCLGSTVVTPNQFSALVSFVFNLGEAKFFRSNLLKLIKEGKVYEAATEFLKWVYAGGRVEPGLVKRRNVERNLFLEPEIPTCGS